MDQAGESGRDDGGPLHSRGPSQQVDCQARVPTRCQPRFLYINQTHLGGEGGIVLYLSFEDKGRHKKGRRKGKGKWEIGRKFLKKRFRGIGKCMRAK